MKLKKLIVFLLSVFVISSTLLPSVAVKAADVQVDVRFRATGWDRGDAINLWNDGHRIYGLGNQFMLMYSTDGTMLYCIEPEVGLHDGDVMDLSNYVDAITTPTIQEPEIVPVLIGRVFQYVDYSVAGNPLNTEGGMALYTATQLLIWETVEGERDEYFNHVTPPSQYGQVLDCLTTAPMDDSIKQLIMDDYNYLVSKVQEHMVIPSFTAPSLTNAQTYQLKSNGGTLSVSLTDNNNVLGNFNFSSNNPNVQFSTAGNTLTVSANSGISGDVNVTLSSIDSRRSGLLCYGDGQEGLQDTVVVSTPIDDPVTSFFKLDVAVGSLEIVKSTQNNNGIVSGFTFEVRNSANTLVGTYTTDSTGKISVPNLQAGTYTVKEVNLSSDFVTPATNPQSITVVAGQSVSVSFNNIKKLGVINVKKNDANPALGGYSLAGAAIEVRDQGGTLVDTIITKADGNGQSKSLPLGVYRLKEVTAPSGFTLDPTTYNSALSGTLGTGSVVYSTDVTITEQPEVGRVNIVKSNANKAMGDYPLNGAVFEIRAAEDMVRIDGSYYAHKGDLMDTVTTNAAGQVQSKDLRLGNYTVTEKSSPFGYIRNQNSFTVKLEYGGQTVPVVYGTASVPETPQSGKIRIHKQDANPNMGDYQLSGAVFEIRAAADIKTTDGTIIYNKGDLVDTATTDATGLAVSKDLPLGEFTISEKSAPFGFVLNVNNYSTKLSYSGQDVTGVFSDVSIPEQPQTGTITVTKYDIATGTRAQGNATLNGAVFEVYAASDIKK
ncbi:MAG: hypothetical protein LBI03_05430, partial [Clostridiales bacterium]|nr:hypothetical protein [Clostridiales bacterium]